MLEAIALCEQITGNTVNWKYVDGNRRGDHIWWISDLTGFQKDYSDWAPKYGVPQILQEIYELNSERWEAACSI